MDLESFRSKYSDLTVTALPPGGKKKESTKANEEDIKMATVEEKPPRVEITRVTSGNGTAYGPPTSTFLGGSSSFSAGGPAHGPSSGVFASNHRGGSILEPSPSTPADGSGSLRTRSRQQTAAALAYACEYKQVMAKLDYTKFMQAKLKQLSASQGQNNAGAAHNSVMTSEKIVVADEDVQGNIVDTFDNLMSVVGKMKAVLNPTVMGMRFASERMLHEITNARLVVKTGQIILKREELDTSVTPSDE
ncbi:uncharacterized protein [Drosophila pseudoobscura]|uniref:Uncharacterized protein n=1 Tax=Drosophila pseudoobscura pseudoobscura TaxID=46245 RepID=A0A6I8UKQ7_DROPS|nr:uncharacterized protein LOC4817677 [Drosophila pseudoobscura]